MMRQPKTSESVRKGAWGEDEDETLRQYVDTYGPGLWGSVRMQTGLQRCGKSCRLRWTNYLRPDIRHGGFSAEEEELIINLHASHGSRWSLIAAHLAGRTDNDVKNHWNTRLKKRLCDMGIDPVTHQPIADLLRDLAGTVGTSGSCGAGGNQVAEEAARRCFRDNMLNKAVRATFLHRSKRQWEKSSANTSGSHSADDSTSIEESLMGPSSRQRRTFLEDTYSAAARQSQQRGLDSTAREALNPAFSQLPEGITTTPSTSFIPARTALCPSQSTTQFQIPIDEDACYNRPSTPLDCSMLASSSASVPYHATSKTQFEADPTRQPHDRWFGSSWPQEPGLNSHRHGHGSANFLQGANNGDGSTSLSKFAVPDEFDMTGANTVHENMGYRCRGLNNLDHGPKLSICTSASDVDRRGACHNNDLLYCRDILEELIMEEKFSQHGCSMHAG